MFGTAKYPSPAVVSRKAGHPLHSEIALFFGWGRTPCSHRRRWLKKNKVRHARSSPKGEGFTENGCRRAMAELSKSVGGQGADCNKDSLRTTPHGTMPSPANQNRRPSPLRGERVPRSAGAGEGSFQKCESAPGEFANCATSRPKPKSRRGTCCVTAAWD